MQKYSSEFCRKVIEHLASGLSLSSFAGVIGVTSETVRSWNKTIEEFHEAVEIGKAKHHLKIDQLMIQAVVDEDIQFKPLQFLAKNRHPESYRDSVELELIKNIDKLTDEELINEIEEMKKKLLNADD